MRFVLQHPVGSRSCAPEFLGPDAVIRLAQAAEDAGFDALAFTEHPAPSHKWLMGGGHDTLDPLTALAFCAAATTRLRLLTFLLVLPYRNPLLAAKQAATVDLLSGGRLTLGVGAGYLRSEFAALGVDFDERNALLDEAMDAMTAIWSGENLAFRGLHFEARGQTQRPGPVQRPHPPLLIGGNSRASRRRVAQRAQGWAPILMDDVGATTTRTARLGSPADLVVALADLESLLDEEHRCLADVEVLVAWEPTQQLAGPYRPIIEAIGRIAEAGGTSVLVEAPGEDLESTLDLLSAYGAEVITRMA